MSNADLVSVILPYYNGKSFIKETIESIVNQTYKNFELLLVDDGSPNKEHSEYVKDLIENQIKDERVKYIYKPNGGLSDARNFGLDNSKGQYITFQDQDDLWDENKLELQVNVAKSNPEAEFIVTDGKMIGDENRGLGIAEKNKFQEGFIKNTYTRLLRGNFVTFPSVFFKRELIDKVGYSNKAFAVCPDYEYLVRFGKETDFYFIDKPLILYRIHENNTSKNYIRLYCEIIMLLQNASLKGFKQRFNANRNMLSVLIRIALLWIKKQFK